jgi:RNA polymerase sigma-70 factor (ECF subfamily)
LTGIPENKPFAAEWVQVQSAVGTFIAASGVQFHDSEDLLQKVAVIAFEKFEDFDPQRAPFLAWVTGIARNEVMHWRRNAGRDRHVFTAATIEILADVQSQTDEESSSFARALAWCVKKLQGRSSEVLTLRYTEELSPTQIAERLDTSSTSIRVTLSRARKSVRECVDRRLRADEVRP